jgi:hypothetical protein
MKEVAEFCLCHQDGLIALEKHLIEILSSCKSDEDWLRDKEEKQVPSLLSLIAYVDLYLDLPDIYNVIANRAAEGPLTHGYSGNDACSVDPAQPMWERKPVRLPFSDTSVDSEMLAETSPQSEQPRPTAQQRRARKGQKIVHA